MGETYANLTVTWIAAARGFALLALSIPLAGPVVFARDRACSYRNSGVSCASDAAASVMDKKMKKKEDKKKKEEKRRRS